MVMDACLRRHYEISDVFCIQHHYFDLSFFLEIPIICAFHGAVFGMAMELARDICSMGPLAVGATKKIIKRGEGVDLMTQLDMEVNLNSILLRNQDFQEGHRPP
jgi:enoyl-CoA hydratase/carnithine racemase